ncbi:Crp/Fnr family transcriptional regulator [Altererythrobacter sp. MF3-039]|uniref:Crp/Fnr family transcriptional regulator n=1 Tax=Altererythrobacter sp. MF3-039 TaxID=3252901 RepID=UPI00390CB2D4
MRDLLRWEDIASGETLMEQGQPQPPFIYVASGAARIDADASQVGSCGHGEFLGEMSLVSGQTATATVTATEPMRVARFDRDALAQLSRTVPEISKAIDAAINRGLAHKVRRSNETLAGHRSNGADEPNS